MRLPYLFLIEFELRGGDGGGGYDDEKGDYSYICIVN